MKLALSKRLNEIVEQYIPASPGLSESVIEWFNDWQRDTSAVDHENLREDIKDLKEEIHAQRNTSDSQFTLLWNSHKDLKDDFKDLKEDFKDIKDDVSQIRDQLTDFKLNTAERFNALEKNTAERFNTLEKNTSERFNALELNTAERFNALEKNTVLMRSELKEQIHGLEKNFLAFQKSIKVTLAWAMLLITGLLFPIALPHIQSWFQR
jgi:seryl-tRNA synthetase